MRITYLDVSPVGGTYELVLMNQIQSPINDDVGIVY